MIDVWQSMLDAHPWPRVRYEFVAMLPRFVTATHEGNRVRPVDEPPGADPLAGWCGEGRLEAGPYPIMRRVQAGPPSPETQARLDGTGGHGQIPLHAQHPN